MPATGVKGVIDGYRAEEPSLDRHRASDQSHFMTGPWWPETELEIETAAAAGDLVESHSFDLKRDLEPGDRGNRALATDLASFAVDGGVLLIGVKEGSPAEPSPVRLEGLKERIDQVARSRVDPPLSVTVREIPSRKGEGLGFVIVVVPASPMGPHMVDYVYRGRGDTTNTRLSDPQVRLLHATRRESLRSIDAILDAEIARDPIKDLFRKNGHIFAVAQPTFGSAEMLEASVANMRNWMSGLRKLPTLSDRFAPDVVGISGVERRANGWALTSLGDGRVPDSNRKEGVLVDLEVREDGGIRLFCGRGSEHLPDLQEGPRVVILNIHHGMCWRVVQIADRVASTTRYVGNWDFGYAATGMLGSIEYVGFGGSSAGRPYSEDVYRAATSATFAEISGDRGVVVSRLLGRLDRGVTGGPYRGFTEAN